MNADQTPQREPNRSDAFRRRLASSALLGGRVYVDVLTDSPPLRTWKWTHAKHCHMFVLAGDEDLLHAMAKRIGLQRRWFQDEKALPHYDLTASKRRQAVQAGAIETDRWGVAWAIDNWRKVRAMAPKLRAAADYQAAHGITGDVRPMRPPNDQEQRPR